MLSKIVKTSQLIGNMGWRYLFFRVWFECKKRTGILQKAFPINPIHRTFYTLDYWRNNYTPFLFKSKDDIHTSRPLSAQLKNDYESLNAYTYSFFSNIKFQLGADYDWMTNPETHYRYENDIHWVNVNDYNLKAGDIKYVWESSRFSHLYTLIRYDKYSGNDTSKRVFDEIERWIKFNKVNQGPNFKCSQEISLRILNWIFALNYYRDSSNLTEQTFSKIQHYIYWQTKHVYDNINFSRIAVRNNHAITECLTLYVVGSLFTSYPDAEKWKNDGKRWFEDEIAYQIYKDGTYLQFSMNYHRVVVQLMTWAIGIAHANNERFTNVVYERAKASLRFLLSCMDAQTGWLPNYGANDGALFFKLNDNHYRDYRPQLEALSNALGVPWEYDCFEDAEWFGFKNNDHVKKLEIKTGYSSFEQGGYHIYRTKDTLSFIRCGNHKDRPSQADNLHLDIWHRGLNVLHDGGSYKYNTSEADVKYFMGTRSHNTIMLNDFDQMQKGSRFIWFFWTQCEAVETKETAETFYFEGTIKAFQYINKNIRHTRKLLIKKFEPIWEIEDIVIGKPDNMIINQRWHTCYPGMLNFNSSTTQDRPLSASFADGYYSSLYGKKETCAEVTFSTHENRIKTIITVN